MFRRNFLSVVLLAGMLFTQSVPRASAATNCDQIQFVSDLSVPDGTGFAPGATFTKTWRLMNAGTCTWTTDYSLVWAGGEVMNAPMSQKLPVSVAPGQMVDLSVNLTAPTFPANYRAFFQLSNASGVKFGMGEAANLYFYVDINVVQVSAVIYDFAANAPYAQWKSGAGALPFPGTSGDQRGYAMQVSQPHLEDDSLDSAPGLLTVPQNKFNGYIQATYPEFQVQQGDRLHTLVNCEFGATGCYATFRIDYLLPNGVQRTLWSWKEAYDKRFYRADINLSALAGQKVRFVFMLLSSGFASGDRAIWGAPRIVRLSTSQPPAPPATLTPLPPLPPTATPIGQPPPTLQPAGCDRAAFVTDVTVPDGTVFAPNAAFTKTWRLKNSGSCSWSTAYQLIYYSGDPLGSSTAVNLPWNTAPGQTVDISVDLVAPGAPAKYRSYWILRNASGQFFGIGADASRPVWVEVNVAGEAPIGTGYDFTSNVCAAEWKSGAGILPCPGADADTRGFIIRQDAPKLEDGSTGASGLLAAPQNRYNGYLQGFYPTFTVQPGDKFQAVVGCAHGAACYLTYRLDYMTSNGYIGTFWQWREQNDGKVYNATVDLSPLAGRSVRFILTTLATGSAANDRAIWGAPRIVRAGGTPPQVTHTPTSTPTQTSTPTASDWLTYTNSTFGFRFQYPPQAQIVTEEFNSLRMDLPFVAGTNLREKYLQMTAREGATPCQSPLAQPGMPGTSENVVINGISFFKQTGSDGGVGHLHEWVSYSTLKGNVCISMDFILHSLHAGNFETPPPVFDKTAESAVFTQMMSTFGWSAPPLPSNSPTPTATATATPDLFLPDLTITQMKIELENPTSCIAPSDGLGARLWITNQGQGPAGSFWVSVNGIGQTVNGLNVGETAEVFFANSSNPVTAAVDTLNTVAESNETNNSRSEMVPVPTPPVACTFSGPYAVTGIAPGDVLNVRSLYGVDYPVIGSFPHDAVDVMRTGPSADVGGALWAEVQLPGGRRGWVNSSYLELYVSHDSFCADARIPALLAQLKGSLNQSNGDLFGSIVSPAHGVNVHLWSYQPPVNFTRATAPTAFTSAQVYNWGIGMGKGGTEPDMGTFAEVIQPKMLETFNAPNMETYCDSPTKVFQNINPWPYPDIRYYHLYKPGTPGTDLDFRTWLIGFDYVNGEPYLHSLVTIVWEP